jgi:hypothetical protein
MAMTILLAILLLGPQDLSPAEKKKLFELRLAVEKSPEDTAANLALGKHLCFVAGEWSDGLPFLAKGGDKDFAPVAEKDLGPKDNALFSIEVADMWLLLEKKHKPFAARIRERAMYHFAEAWPKISDQVWKDKTRERLRTLQQKGPESKTMGPASANWSAVGIPSGVDRQYARSGMSSLKIPAPDPAKKVAVAGVCSDLIPCQPGAKIKFSGWVLSSGTEAIDELRVKLCNSKSQILSVVTVKSTPDLPIWTKIDGEATAPDGTHNVEISFKRGANGGGVIFLDDLSLTVDGKEVLKNGGFEK